MTKVAFFALNSLIKEKFPDIAACKKAASIAVGIVASRLAQLPSSQVDSAEEHFAHNVRGAAEDLIACFNEEIVVDVDLANETARSFWLVRYFSAYPCVDGSLGSNGTCEFLLKLTGGVRFLNEDTAAFCQANDQAMILLINRITLVLKTPEEVAA